MLSKAKMRNLVQMEMWKGTEKEKLRVRASEIVREGVYGLDSRGDREREILILVN